MSTFVSVGNDKKPFSRLLDAVMQAAAHLPQPVIVQHGHTPFSHADCVSVPFLEMQSFVHHIASSELVILHAGAGSVIHAVQAGKVPVVMARRAAYHEHIDDHQLEFARVLAEQHKVVHLEDPRLIEDAVARARAMQHNRSSRTSEPEMVNLVRSILQQYAVAQKLKE